MKTKRGGYRPGAGRPKAEHSKATVSLRLPITLLAKIDVIGEKHSLTRSEVIAGAIEQGLKLFERFLKKIQE